MMRGKIQNVGVADGKCRLFRRKRRALLQEICIIGALYVKNMGSFVENMGSFVKNMGSFVESMGSFAKNMGSFAHLLALGSAKMRLIAVRYMSDAAVMPPAPPTALCVKCVCVCARERERERERESAYVDKCTWMYV